MGSAVHYATFVLSLLPVAWLEWLLSAVAWCQLFILSARSKGAIQSQEHKKKKKKKNKKKKAEEAGLNPPSSPPQQQQHQQYVGNSEVDLLGETILYEANEQHRREFEGFLRSVKDIKDVHNWLKNFSNEAPRKVAIVKLSRRILDTDYGTAQAASALSFMFKFGLYPIVVHGGWNELINDTITEVVARRKLYSQRLKAEIRKCGVGAAVLTPDVCSVQPAINRSNDPFQENTNFRFSGFVSAVGEGRRGSLHMEGGLGFQVNNIDYSRFTAYLEKGKIPIWDGVAVTKEGAEIPLNGDVTTVELAHLLQPFKIIFACNDGGILDKDNKAIPVVYMDKDYEDLMSASWVSQRRKIQLLQLKRIVSVVPPSCTVVVTAIDAVTHQLMYPRLANETLVKRVEENVVHVIEDINEVDTDKLQLLIEDSFGRPLAPDYLESLSTSLHRMYLVTGMDGEYNGCAVILNGVHWESSASSDSDSDVSAHDDNKHTNEDDNEVKNNTDSHNNDSNNNNNNNNNNNDNNNDSSENHSDSDNQKEEQNNHKEDSPLSSPNVDHQKLTSPNVDHQKLTSQGEEEQYPPCEDEERERKRRADTNAVHVAQKHAEHVYAQAQKHLDDLQHLHHHPRPPLSRTSSDYVVYSSSPPPLSSSHPSGRSFSRSKSSYSLARSGPVFSRSASSRVLTRNPSSKLSLVAPVSAPVNDDSSTNSVDYQFYYLCKFCVRKSAQGLGLGDLLWRSIQRDIDKLYWRSRTNNPLNPWYYARCQGSFRANGHFTVFWYGDDKFEDGATLIEDALAKPVSILPIPT